MTYQNATALKAAHATPELVREHLRNCTTEAENLLDRAARAKRDLLASEAREFERLTRDAGDLSDLLEDATAAQARAYLRERQEREERDQAIAASRARSGFSRVFAEGGAEPTGDTHALGRLLERAISGGTTPGSAFAPTEYLQLFDFLAASSAVLASPVNRITTGNRSVTIPHLTADATGGWYDENAAITASDVSAESIVITPTKVAELGYISNELIVDSQANVPILDMEARSLVRKVGLIADLGLLEGSGSSSQPTGLKNVSGITTQTNGTNGATATLDMIQTAMGTLRSNNATATAIYMHPRTFTTLASLKDTTGRYLFQGVSDPATSGYATTILGVPTFTTTQIGINEVAGSASDCSSIYVVQADQLAVVVRDGGPMFEVDRSVGFASDQTAVRCTMRIGMAVPNPKAVVRISGVRA